MPRTLGRWESNTGYTDGQRFIGAEQWFQVVPYSTASTLTLGGPGLHTWNVPVSTGASFVANLTEILRTGQLATPAVNQEQFGTAALVPGPSSVANTSDPLNLPAGFPPNWNTSAGGQNPTISGGLNTPVPKGIKPLSVDVIYEVDTGALTSVTFGLTKTIFPAAGASAAPVVTNIIALAANGLPTAVNTAGQCTRTRINVATANQLYLTADGTELLANIVFTTPANNTAKFYGIILNYHFNYC